MRRSATLSGKVKSVQDASVPDKSLSMENVGTTPPKPGNAGETLSQESFVQSAMSSEKTTPDSSNEGGRAAAVVAETPSPQRRGRLDQVPALGGTPSPRVVTTPSHSARQSQVAGGERRDENVVKAVSQNRRVEKEFPKKTAKLPAPTRPCWKLEITTEKERKEHLDLCQERAEDSGRRERTLWTNTTDLPDMK